jgi:polyisoprenoid-binding protein YceI
MKKFNTLFVLLLVAGSTFAQTWSLDKAHNKLEFSVTHMLLSEVSGSFKVFNAKVTTSKDDLSDAVFELTAEVNSINTDNENRDAHLKKPDFFDAAQFPTLTFKSTSFKKVDGKKYKLVGNLTIHGITKPVELDATLNGPTVHPYMKDKKVFGLKATGTIKRSDFGVGAGTPEAAVSDEVAIVASAEFFKD